MKIVIGLVGHIASGKGVAASHLEKKHKATVYRFSDVLKDILARLHLPNNRRNLQELGKTLRVSYGDGILAQSLKKDILEGDSSVVVVDGIRYQDEYEMVSSLKNAKIIYIHAPAETRYARTLKRATRGEAGQSFEDFLRVGSGDTESAIEVLGACADAIIENTGTVLDLENAVDTVFEGLI